MSDPTPQPRRRRSLTRDEVALIHALRATGMPQKAIAIRLRVSPSCVCLVLKGKRHGADAPDRRA
jgi:DNA-binding NarL/FixJ family response regulator